MHAEAQFRTKDSMLRFYDIVRPDFTC